MRKGIANEDLHLFATNLIENRLTFNHLPNDSPLGDIKTFPRHKFSPNAAELKRYNNDTKIIKVYLGPMQTKKHGCEISVILEVSSNVSMFAYPWKHCYGSFKTLLPEEE